MSQYGVNVVSGASAEILERYWRPEPGERLVAGAGIRARVRPGCGSGGLHGAGSSELESEPPRETSSEPEPARHNALALARINM